MGRTKVKKTKNKLGFNFKVLSNMISWRRFARRLLGSFLMIVVSLFYVSSLPVVTTMIGGFSGVYQEGPVLIVDIVWWALISTGVIIPISIGIVKSLMFMGSYFLKTRKSDF